MKYLILLLLVTMVIACSKINDASLADFDVKTRSSDYQKGDTVIFAFTGNPFQVTFYSGETGKKYEYSSTPAPGITKTDVAVPIKSYTDIRLNSFSFVYPAAGTYTATFIASSTTTYSSEQKIKTITLVIH